MGEEEERPVFIQLATHNQCTSSQAYYPMTNKKRFADSILLHDLYCEL